VRNYVRTGHFDFTSMTGQHQLFWNVAYLKAYQQKADFKQIKEELIQQYRTPEILAWDPGLQNVYHKKEGVKIILESKRDYAIVILRSLPRFFLGTPPVHSLLPRRVREQYEQLKIQAFGDRHVRFSESATWMMSQELWLVLLAGLLVKIHLVVSYGAAFVGWCTLWRVERGRWVAALLAGIVVFFGF
jgi:hypothetical protein